MSTPSQEQLLALAAVKLGLIGPGEAVGWKPGEGETAPSQELVDRFLEAHDGDLERVFRALDGPRVFAPADATVDAFDPALFGLDSTQLGGDPNATLDAPAPHQPGLSATITEDQDLGLGATLAEDVAPSTAKADDDALGETLAEDSRLALGSTLAEDPEAWKNERPGTVDIPLSTSLEESGRYHYAEGDDADASEIGRGGIGRVLRATDTHLGRAIAVKELLLRDDASPITKQRFLREARITGQLEHPNIVPVHELGRREDGTLYYTMKLVRGGTLADALDACSSLEERLRYLDAVLDLCHAMAYAHARGVVHRDIKPENLMLGEFGETLVLDWGLAKARGTAELQDEELARAAELLQQASGSHTLAGQVLGTPAYMPPEQASGDIDRIDERSDVWSLGAVLFEVLTGQPPFTGESAYNILFKVIQDEVPNVLSLCPDAPPELVAVVGKALTRNREDRYPNAGALAEELEAFLTGSRVGAYTYSSWELIKRFIERNKTLSIALAVGLVVLVASSIAIFYAYQNAESARVRAESAQAAEAQARQTAVAAQDAERAQRLKAESSEQQALDNERQAHQHLAHAYINKALQREAEADHASALLYAAAAVHHAPVVEGGPFAWPDPQQMTSDDSAHERARLQSALYAPTLHAWLSLETALPLTTEVTALAFLEDGRLITTSTDRQLRIWNAGQVEQQWRLDFYAHSLHVHSGAIYVAGRPSSVARYTPGRDAPEALPPFPEPLAAVALSPNGTLLAASGQRGGFWVLDLRDGTLRDTVQLPRANALAFHPTRPLVALGIRNGRVLVYDLESQSFIHRLFRHSGSVHDVAWSHDGTLLATGSVDRTLQIWSEQGEHLREIENTDLLRDLAFSPTQPLLAGASPHASHLWDPRTGRLVETLPLELEQVAFSPDGRQLATGSDAHLGLWTVQPPAAQSLVGHDETVVALAFAPDYTQLASGGEDQTVRLWNRQSGEYRILGRHELFVWGLAFSPDGSRLASIGADQVLKLWDTRAATLLAEATVTEGTLPGLHPWSVAFSPDGRHLVTNSLDRTVHVYSVPSLERELVLGGLGQLVTSVAISKDGSRIAAGSSRGDVALWSWPEGQRVRLFQAHDALISGLAFSPDGTRLATSSADTRVKLWSLTAPDSEPIVMTGHSAWVNRVYFSPDGSLLASGSDDTTARLWDSQSGRPLLTIPTESELTALAFSPDRLAYADGARIVVAPLLDPLWTQGGEALLNAVEKRYGVTLNGFEVSTQALYSHVAPSTEQPPPTAGSIRITVRDISTGAAAPKATVQLVDATTGDVVGTPVDTDTAGTVVLSLPNDMQRFGLQITYGGSTTLLFRSTYVSGTKELLAVAFARSTIEPYASPGKGIVRGILSYGDALSSEPVGCARATVSGADRVLYSVPPRWAGTPERDSTHPGFAAWFATGLEPGPSTITVDVDNQTQEQSVPRVVPNGVTLVDVVLDPNRFAHNPTPRECR